MSTRAPPLLLWGLDVFVSVGMAFVLFTALFRYLPETDVTLHDAMICAAVSTALFAIGSGLVTLYVRHKDMDAVYEGASAIVLAVLWVYYSAQVFFFGACVGALLRQRSSRTAVP